MPNRKSEKSDSAVIRESSASKLLKGLEYKGKKIESVWAEGEGARRVIVFGDGSSERTTKKKVANLARIKGTIQQINKYHDLGPAERRKLLERSRSRQYSTKQATLNRLVDKLARARSKKSKKRLRDQIKAVMSHSGESPLVTGSSVADIGSKSSGRTKKQVGDLKNVRWISIRRGRRYVRIPIQEKQWASRSKKSVSSAKNRKTRKISTKT
jgi:hypothetical protein